MPRSRPRRRLRRSLRSEAAATLGRDLALIARTSTHAFDRRSRRVAFTFATSYGDGLPDGPVVLSELRLVALGHRLCDDGLGGIRGRAPLVVLRPEVDFAIDGRVRFVPEAVFDLAARGA